jgi:pimeloyl-ACP methyl ester carboxylesterase
MFIPAFLAGMAAVASASAIPVLNVTNINTDGFSNPTISVSAGGHALCVAGLVHVEATTTQNVELHLPAFTSRAEATEIVVDLNSANSSLVAQVTGPPKHISQTFSISSQICYPRNSDFRNTTTIQFLTHGIAFSKSYWEFSAPANSYIDTAALAGRVTFSYDRLGVGGSVHPDPVQIVQGPLEIAIAHSLITLLRNGTFLSHPFTHVIGVGHSYGSAITTTVAETYPSDFDAVVVTGFSLNISGAPQFASSLNLIPAAQSQIGSFSDLPLGYIVPSSAYGIQYSFFRFPNFSQRILSKAFATVETTTWGEQFTMDTVGSPAPAFEGPVFVVNGEHDLFFCDGNCLYPHDVALATLQTAFPHADPSTSSSFILSGSGHGLNLASNAEEAFSQIQDFVAKVRP